MNPDLFAYIYAYLAGVLTYAVIDFTRWAILKLIGGRDRTEIPDSQPEELPE